MDGAKTKTSIIRYTVIFGVVYALMWVASGVFVYLVDYFYEHFTGIKLVNGWTPGIMVWSLSLYVIPILFLLGLLGVYFRGRKVNDEGKGE